jgi:two-component system LytT family response regulator
MIKCIAVDDSPLALDLLEDYAKRTGILQLERKCTSALEAARILSNNNYDLVFLDVQMPDFTGIDLAKVLDKRTKVIFTTAYSDFAVEGFNLNAVDYLLKPFSFQRFSKAVNKAAKLLETERTSALPNKGTDGRAIYIRSGYDTVKVELSDIEYIEALKDYVQVFTSAGKIISLMGMKDILAMLPLENFIRVHRSYIVSLSSITRVSPKKIFVGKKEIPIGDIFRGPFTERMTKRIS